MNPRALEVGGCSVGMDRGLNNLQQKRSKPNDGTHPWLCCLTFHSTENGPLKGNIPALATVFLVRNLSSKNMRF